MGREATFVQHTPLVYERVSASIRDRIERGRLGPGDRLPPIRTLSRDFGCNYHTVRRALEVLEREGLVERVPGSGTFVRSPSMTARARRTRADGRAACARVYALVPDVSNPYLGRLIMQLQQQAVAQHIELGFDVLPDIDVEHITSRFPAKPGVDAIVLPWFTDRNAPDVRKLLEYFEVPVVTHLPVPGYESYCYKADGVLGQGSRQVTRIACEYFAALGFRHVALLGPARSPGFEFQNRLSEYTLVAHEQDVEVRVFLAGPKPEDYLKIAECSRTLREPLAVIACYDWLAIRLMNVLNRERIDVPGSVAVLGYNNSQGCETTLPTLSSMACPFDFLAAGMLRHARALAAGKSDQVDTVDPARFVIRDSCGGKRLRGKKLDGLLKKLQSGEGA